MSIFALVDCNNFYASCERVFNPRLIGKPIVVLSNNDGCVIARSNEAKDLGIPMGAPYYQHKSFIEKNNVKVFSSNYQFYGDMSQRVMKSLSMMLPNQDVEIYSIDEAFLRLDGFAMRDLFDWSLEVRNNILQWTGIPTSIGIAPTKTLSKIANHVAKKQTESGVFDLRDTDLQEYIMADLPVEELWGISRRWGKTLRSLGISTALQLRNTDPKFIQKKLSVVVERMVYELQGLSCLDLEKQVPKKSIMSSKSFGTLLDKLEPIEQALSTYAVRACEKLRQQGSKAKSLYIFLQTNPFRVDQHQYRNSLKFEFDLPTSDTAVIIRVAKTLLKQIYKYGYYYHKCGIMLFNLVSEEYQQGHFFTPQDSSRDSLMKSIDIINESMGRETIFYAAQGVNQNWKMKRNNLSPRYTTNWEELVKVY
ncbi:MAG: Y-family DNA polymerase [Dehalococcoidia bacterium]